MNKLEALREYLKDKRVVLVGNSESVLKTERDIDLYDVIIRMNWATPKGKEKYIGSRTDILATSLPFSNIEFFTEPKHYIWLDPRHKNIDDFLKDRAVFYERVSWEYLKLLLNNYMPSTGCMTLDFLLSEEMPFKSLDIVGFDFWQTSTWYRTERDMPKYVGPHSPKDEERFFTEIVDMYENVNFIL